MLYIGIEPITELVCGLSYHQNVDIKHNIYYAIQLNQLCLIHTCSNEEGNEICVHVVMVAMCAAMGL